MESIQHIFLFVLCMTAVSKSSARIGFTGIDMTAAATDLPPSTPEMDNCREACQQKVQINEYSSFLSVSFSLYSTNTFERALCARRNIRFCNAENANGIGRIISKEINSFKKNCSQIDVPSNLNAKKKKQQVKTVFRKTRKIFPMLILQLGD